MGKILHLQSSSLDYIDCYMIPSYYVHVVYSSFAFAYFETIQDCKRVVAALNGKVMFGSTLLVKTCRDRSRARYIADDGKQPELI